MKQIRARNTFLVLTLLTALSATASCGKSKAWYGSKIETPQPRVEITSPVSGSELHTNLAVITGTVSPGAAVTVAGNDAFVSSSGSFQGYTLLAEGENTIEVKAMSAGRAVSQELKLTFIPPLAVFLDFPRYDAKSPEKPVFISGEVSDPSAAVTLDGASVTVSSDGSFTAEVQVKKGGNRYTAVATRGSETDTASVSDFIDERGRFIPPPGGPGGLSIFSADFDGTVYLKPGATVISPASFKGNKYAREVSPLSYRITPQALINFNFQPAAWPAGIELSIAPSNFQVDPRAEYKSLLVVAASPGTPAGEYHFEIETTTDYSRTSMVMKVVVMPEGAVLEKTISVHRTEGSEGIAFTLDRVEFTATGFKAYAFNVPPGYTLPQGPDRAPPEFMLLPEASYRIDGGPVLSAGTSGISFSYKGTRHVWEVDLPVASGAKEMEFTIGEPGQWGGSWRFTVPLE